MQTQKIYLDHAATTPVAPAVLDKMLPYFSADFGNANSQHGYGRTAALAVDAVRRTVAEQLGAKPNEIYFTSGGTEANNWALRGVAEARAKAGAGRHIIVSAIEHHSVLTTAELMAKNGYEVSFLPVDAGGIVKLDELKKLLRKDTTLVSVMYANNEVGTIQPIKQIAQIVHEAGALFHTDCVQAAGSCRLDVRELGADLLTISAHKLYGPKGVGALYIRSGLKIERIITGGGQERYQRGGTTNVPAVVGLAEAFALATAEMDANNVHIKRLRDRFIERVEAEIPYVRLNGDRVSRLVGNANFSFEFIEGEGILMLLDMAGVAVSSGSACSSGSLDPSHVLLAMGVPVEIAHGSIRFSFGKHNIPEEVDYTVERLKEVVARLRAMSPLFSLKEGGLKNV